MSFLGRGPALQGGHAAGDVSVSGRRVSLVKHIAEGGFGFISVVQDHATHRTLVLKRAIAQSREAANMARMELDLLKRLNHPNIIRCEGTEARTYGPAGIEALLLLEYCPGGHLLDYLNSLQGRSLPEREVLDIHRQITSAVEYLHAQNPPIVHRDLKLENVLRAGSVFKLCDFGSCVIGHVPLSNAAERANAEEAIEKATTQMYRAPEMCDLYMQPVLTEKTDVWALGCMLYATCFLVHPFNNAGNLGIINARVTFPSSSPYGENMHNLILHQLQRDPESRVSATQVSQYIRQMTEGRSIPVPAAQPEPEPQRRQLAPKPAAPEHKAAPKQPKHLDPNSLAARRLAERKGGRRRSYTEADAGSQEPVQQLAASFDAFGLSGSRFAAMTPTATFDAFGVGVSASAAGTTAPVASAAPAAGQGDPFFDPFALSSSLQSPQRQSSTTEPVFDPFGFSASSPTAASQDWGSAASPRVEYASRASVSSYVSVSERVSSPVIPEHTSALSRSPEDFHVFPMSPCARSPKREQPDLFEMFATPSSPAAAQASVAVGGAAASAASNSHGLTRQRSAPAVSTSMGFDPFGIGDPFQQQPSPVAAQHMQHQQMQHQHHHHHVGSPDLFAQHGFPAGAYHQHQQGTPLQRSVSDGHWMPPGVGHHPHPPHPAFQPSFHQSLPNQQLPQHRPGHVRHMTSPAAPGHGQIFAGSLALHPQAQTQFDQFFGSGGGAVHSTQPFSQPF